MESDAPASCDEPVAGNAAIGSSAIAAVCELLLTELGDRFPGDYPGPALLARTVHNLRGAPTSLLREAIRARRWTANDSMGLVEFLAEDVGKRWVADRRLEARRKQERAAAEIRALEEIVADEAEPEDVRQSARARLAAYSPKNPPPDRSRGPGE